MQMSIYIRPRSKGSAFELRVKHKRLARPAYATLGSREAAEALGHRTLAALERGEMPDWLKEPVRRECDTIADLIRAYRGIIATAELSRMFADVFQGAGSRDLHFHDTRHEAVCRWVLNTDITSEQLGRAAGMRDAPTRARYLSLRGSEIAAVLNTCRPVGESAGTTVDR
jgi:integrase